MRQLTKRTQDHLEVDAIYKYIHKASLFQDQGKARHWAFTRGSICLFLILQRDPTSPSWRRSVLGVHWKDWCWSWNCNTLATWCKELTHLKRPWCWERLRAGGEGDDRGWGGWMASPTRRTWVWASSRSWWRTGRPGVLQSMGWSKQSDTTEWLNCTELILSWRVPTEVHVLEQTEVSSEFEFWSLPGEFAFWIPLPPRTVCSSPALLQVGLLGPPGLCSLLQVSLWLNLDFLLSVDFLILLCSCRDFFFPPPCILAQLGSSLTILNQEI